MVYYSICRSRHMSINGFYRFGGGGAPANQNRRKQRGTNTTKVSLPDNRELYWPLTCVYALFYTYVRARERQRREKVSAAVIQHVGSQSHTALIESEGVYVCVRGRGNRACGVLFWESPSFEWGNPSFSLSGTGAITPFRCQLTA